MNPWELADNRLHSPTGDVQATAASLLHWNSGLGLVDHFKTLVPGLHASSSVPVWNGMPKVKEDQRPTVYLISGSGILQVSSSGTLVLPNLRLCSANSGRRDTSPSSIATTSAMPSLRRPCLWPKQRPHVPAVVSSQVPWKRNRSSSLSSFSSRGRSACPRRLSVGVRMRFCRMSLALMVWMCMLWCMGTLCF